MATFVAVHNNAPIFKPAFEYQESTLQLPFGEFSIFSELKANRVSPLEAMVTLTLCYRSNWSTGLTWRTSSRRLADLLHASHRYVRDALQKVLGEWAGRKTQPIGNIAGTFQLIHHRCNPQLIPMDEDDRPLSFAVPRGIGGVFERLFAGDISWKAALVWLLLKLHSDWRTGITDKTNMATLAKRVGFGKRTVCDLVKQLGLKGMLQRLSKPWECSVFQLYPKPYENRAERRRAKRKQEKWHRQEMRAEGDWRYSYNGCYRVNVATTEIECRLERSRGHWQPIKDRERHQIPKAIRRDFDRSIEAAQSLRRLFGGPDTAQRGSHNAQGGSHNAHPTDTGRDEPAPSLGL